MTNPVLKNGHFVDDPWRLLTETEPTSEGVAHCILPVASWQQHRDALIASEVPTGVWIEADFPPEDLAADLPHLAVVAVHFPAFSDGRGYSAGRLLRERYDFTGELRAFGDIGLDQLYYLMRCGFDAFVLPAAVSTEDAAKALHPFEDAYQGAVDQPLPRFRRRDTLPGA